MIDIKVDDDWQLTRAANGDAPVTGGDAEAFLQSIRLESLTQEGDLFYDLEYGWSLLDFIHTEDSELLRVAIKERIRSKMARYAEVDISSLKITIQFKKDSLMVYIAFKRFNDDKTYDISIILDRIRMEVTDG